MHTWYYYTQNVYTVYIYIYILFLNKLTVSNLQAIVFVFDGFKKIVLFVKI